MKKLFLLCAAACLLTIGTRGVSEGASSSPCVEVDPNTGDCLQTDPSDDVSMDIDIDCTQEPVPEECKFYTMNDDAEDPCSNLPEGVKCEDISMPGTSDCNCIEIWAPVCGADGKVYANTCKAQCEKVSVKFKCFARRYSDSKCRQVCKTLEKPVDCMCPLIYAPVCGKDGNVYDNDCFARCAKTKVVSNCDLEDKSCGQKCECRAKCGKGKKCYTLCMAPERKPCFCPMVYAPVCAKNGRVYNNPCIAKCAKSSTKFHCGKSKLACSKNCKK